jgi:hypothetical protein
VDAAKEGARAHLCAVSLKVSALHADQGLVMKNQLTKTLNIQADHKPAEKNARRKTAYVLVMLSSAFKS